MNAYQRGNRDGLLNAAAEMTEREKAYRMDAARISSGPGYRGHAIQLRVVQDCLRDAKTCADIATRLRALSLALPEDPEDPIDA